MADTRSLSPTLRTVLFVVIAVLVVIWLIPLVVAVITSLRTNNDILTNGFLALPEAVSFQSFADAWTRGDLDIYLPNSFIITLPALFGTLALSSLGAYSLARFRFKGRLLFYFLFVGGTMLPFQILLLPVFRLSDALGIYDTYMGVIAIHVAFQLGFCTFVLRNYMMTVPVQLMESALLDGASEMRIWWSIMLPLTVPAFAAIATLEFTWIFNDYLWALILIRSSEKMPVTTGLAILQGQYVQDWTVIISGALMATIPTLLVFVFLQRYFIAGLTLGSSK
ncbi:MAG: ABC transporter permease subunit [Spirochaetes bacterium]|jgi:multiple sugar transport system permease protein|nr:ABC transporter permease subunit [Spirochaetota bacterium]